MFTRIRWRIALPFMFLILLAIGILSTYAINNFRASYLAELRERLGAEADLVADLVAPLVQGPDPLSQLEAPVDAYARNLGARVTIIAPDGVVLADSEANPATMANHRFRPEIRAAFRDGQGSSMRVSETVDVELMYVATRIEQGGLPVGVSRVAVPVSDIDAKIARLRGVLALASLVTLGVAFALAVYVAERTARPITQLTRVAERVAEGDLSSRLWPTTQDEVGRLTNAFNHMASELEEELEALEWERSQMSGVLSHMADGVLIVNEEGRVVLVNPAAARILGTTTEEALGRSFAQAVRHYQLVDLYQDCVASGREQSAAIDLAQNRQFLQVIVTPLEQEQHPGHLVMLQDLTRVRRLETVRRDFVQNISHELRTPLASLKALVETLQDGALEDPPAAQRFLALAQTEIDALSQMVQELLELVRIESAQVPLSLEPVSPADFAEPPVERLRPQAARAALEVTTDIPEDLPLVCADPVRMQQVFTNLVHNAIKFTPPGGSIHVSARREGDHVVFAVRDTGVGISPDDLPRIFERFYKADRSRSGGGTGLGLAISKHLVQAHGGRIWAESVEGEGSTFYFSLPLAREPASMGQQSAGKLENPNH